MVFYKATVFLCLVFGLPVAASDSIRIARAIFRALYGCGHPDAGGLHAADCSGVHSTVTDFARFRG
ncbi:hypothetical protein AOE01nite_06040 [Acetobacter oeni]|uniref:Uncharacterized protein n=1 Tax=Acetobacter oeni TaxID=304077 RepID=A0A511XHF6_9PROT|nr:hypothetical protein AOE01nite_06040 [Acetobacter oeni]